MNHINGTLCATEVCPLPIEESMTNILHETLCMAKEAGSLACNISRHLFGAQVNESNCGVAKCAESTCFKDEMIFTRNELKMAIAELAEICAKIGV